jgi:D-tyrosyl-tRNA(Tyr) deacylase
MRTVIQRVNSAAVHIDGKEFSSINKGLLVLVGFEDEDNEDDLIWMANKLLNLRVFSDDTGQMNLDIKDVRGEILIVSQFTLHAKTKKGNRPSFIRAAHPDRAIPLYQSFLNKVSTLLQKPVASGDFGANMQISLINDGPVTLFIDTKDKQ